MKFYLRTHGCRANQYDSEATRAMLLAHGGVEVLGPSDADVAIFNSCSVTAAAEADMRKAVRRAARDNPRLRSVIMGCAPGIPARDERVAPLRTLPTVSDTVAGADLDAIASALGLNRKLGVPNAKSQTGARGLLRIQDGCDEHCTFCATTLARGSNRSRDARQLVDEARELADVHSEIVLTGIHIGSYGVDVGTSLSLLVESLVREVPSVRFRLSSLEATEVDDRLLDLLVDGTHLAPYLHAPLQSGSNRILKRMGRHWYSAETYAARIERIAKSRAVFGFGADVISGFPGESEEDHRATVELVERLPFTSLHVFRYSPRPGTSAIRLPAQVGSGDAEGRSGELREIAARKATDYRASRAGGVADVVAISQREGLTEDYLSVYLSGTTVRRRERFSANLAAQDGRLTARVA
ncbi:MAG: MiaB/RimO family radical SAM methylthiotransferase [Gemmatimonadaceae bacterium]